MTTSNTFENGAAAENAEAKLAEAARTVQEEMDAALARGSEEVKRVSENTGRFVRENPGLALAGAAGLGLLVGLALRNRY